MNKTFNKAAGDCYGRAISLPRLPSKLELTTTLKAETRLEPVVVGPAPEYFVVEDEGGAAHLAVNLPFGGDERFLRVCSAKATVLPPIHGIIDPKLRTLRLTELVLGGGTELASALLTSQIATVGNHVRMLNVVICDYGRHLPGNVRAYIAMRVEQGDFPERLR